MIAGNKQHWRGPARVLGQRRKALQTEIFPLNLRATLVGANVARQHQHIGALCRPGLELRVNFKVQIGEQLNLHGH